MRTELRFLLAIGLMVLVLVGTNVLFPPLPPPDLGMPPDSALVDPVDPTTDPPDPAATVDSSQIPQEEGPSARDEAATAAAGPGEPESSQTADTVDVEPVPAARVVTVDGPLFRFRLSTHGARVLSAELPEFGSFTRDGSVQLIPDGETSAMGHRLLVAGGDTVDLRRVPFEPSTEALEVTLEGGPETLTFTYDDPSGRWGLDLAYTFHPDLYGIEVTGAVRGIDAGVLYTDLGSGVAFNEADTDEESRLAALVTNHTDRGIRATPMRDIEGTQVDPGPFFWVVLKSKFFMFGALAGVGPESEEHFGGLIARERMEEDRADLTVTQPFGPGGRFAFRVYAGPQNHGRLSAYGHDLEDANPYGWRWMRPVIRPFTGLIITVLNWMHDRFSLAYGWVLVIFGVMMRVVFFPLYHRSMKAQLKNMAVQPLLKEIQTKYKDNPEKMQKELMKLYKEHGFNPLAGCLPMLLPWPVLVALFFVFQNTIELRGVPFLWLPDLSLKDPYYILPILLGVSMFLLQWVGFRSMDQVNPQMKMMMWFMPIFLVFIFFQLPSGLNLYYATANLATLPQQFWIAGERKKARVDGPVAVGNPPPEDVPAGDGKSPKATKGSSKRRAAKKR